MKRLICTLALLVVLVGSIFSQQDSSHSDHSILVDDKYMFSPYGEVYGVWVQLSDGSWVPIESVDTTIEEGKPGIYWGTSKISVPLEEEEVQVVDQSVDSPATALEQGLSHDSLTKYVASLMAGLSTTRDITNYNENVVNFVYEDSIFAEEVVKILNETSGVFASLILSKANELSQKVGAEANEYLKTLSRRKELEAKAYLAWPILVVLSLALLTIGTTSERKLLQYIASALLVVSVVKGIDCLPDVLVHMSVDEYNILDLLFGIR